jgi:Asp/Glu/hydantoin racemase
MPRRILLINPNSSTATTDMMVAIAQEAAGDDCKVIGATAARSPRMIVEPKALAASVAEVGEIARANHEDYDGLIVAAFGDPGLAEIRATMSIPATGIAEAAMLEAVEGDRRFGIATTTPGLAVQMNARVDDLGLRGRYTGIRFTDGEPNTLVADPGRLRDALAKVVELCVGSDGAEAVIIGGGPLAQAARQLQPLFSVPIIAPIPAAALRLMAMIGSTNRRTA